MNLKQTLRHAYSKPETDASDPAAEKKSFSVPCETIRGRKFSKRDIVTIKKLATKYFLYGRTRISVEICKALEWEQPNGWLKDRACREVLRILAAKNYFRLPEPKSTNNNVAKYSKVIKLQLRNLNTTPITSIDLFSLDCRQVKGNKEEPLWNCLVNKHHYLGFKLFVGRYLKYLIYSEGRIVAALGLCDPAWSVAARDIPLTNIGFEITEIRSRSINNGRFLIMPWVKVENLASRILSIAINRFVVDWASYYSIEPILMETFVDPSRFNGTCYRAANWLYMGKSSGYLKSGPTHHNSQTPKMLFVYPLTKDLKKRLHKHLKESNDVVCDG